MAIVRKSITTYNEGSSTLTTHTISHTTEGYYRGLFLNLQTRGYGAPASVTYNGVAMISAGNDGNNSYQYYLVNPALGTNNIVVTFGSGGLLYAVAISYTGVSQTTMVPQTVTSFDSGAVVSLTMGGIGISNAQAVTLGNSTFNETISEDAGFYYNFIDTFVVNGVRTGDSAGVVPSTSFTIRVRDASTSGFIYAIASLIAPDILIPLFNTTTYDNLSQTSVRALSEVLYDGDATITERGFVYNTVTLPTTTNSKKVVTGTVGAYTGDITGLTVNTTYYVRAYAINANGTAYSNEVTFTTLNIPQYELQYELGASDGDTYIGQINVTGTVGTITVQLGSTGTSTVINAGAGASTFTGTYSGLSGLIITRSADFNGTIDDVYYAKVPLGTTIDWTLNTVAITTSIPSEVFFKRVEDQIFNNFRFYRYLDLLFKDLDGYVTVTVRQEREDNTTEKSKVFVVGNTGSGTVSPFQKKRISFLCKDQAIIIGLSNDNLNETFSIAQYLLIGDKKPRRTISPSKIISIS